MIRQLIKCWTKNKRVLHQYSVKSDAKQMLQYVAMYLDIYVEEVNTMISESKLGPHF